MTTFVRRAGALAVVLALLGGCATVPVGPALTALPGTQRSTDQFANDDVACREQARAYVDPSAAQRSNDAAAANVVGGTLLGATIGALLGSTTGDAGAGAAIGAGFGALGGSAVAADRSGYSSGQLQAIYDRVYLQCMYARGHRVPAPAVAYRSPRGYEVPRSTAPASGFPPRDAPPPRGYPPPSTVEPAGGFPPADAPPPRR